MSHFGFTLHTSHHITWMTCTLSIHLLYIPLTETFISALIKHLLHTFLDCIRDSSSHLQLRHLSLQSSKLLSFTDPWTVVSLMFFVFFGTTIFNGNNPGASSKALLWYSGSRHGQEIIVGEVILGLYNFDWSWILAINFASVSVNR